MRTPLKAGLVALTVAAVLAVPVSVASAQPNASSGGNGGRLSIVGLVDGTKLVNYTSNNTRAGKSRDVKGLAGDVRLVGIDYRVQDGKLYGVGNAGGVYSITDAGQASKVKQLTVALTGTNFGVDFNPAANALRVISDTGQNLRQPFADLAVATVADGALAYTAGTPATGVTGAAYTNNDLDPDTATTLYDLDTAMDQIAIQSPANAGSLAPTGKLGVDVGPNAGFDIYSTVRNGSTVDVTGFATAQVGAGRYSLYRITLFTGKADRIGNFDRAVTDIAIPLNQR